MQYLLPNAPSCAMLSKEVSAVSKMVAVRVDEDTVAQVEKVRDPARFPTQSDFVREAIKRMIREERRRRVAAEIDEAMRNQQEVKLAEELAEASARDLAGELARLGRRSGD